MRNDARPIGEALRHGHDVERRENDDAESRKAERRPPASQDRSGFITGHDPGDEERPPKKS